MGVDPSEDPPSIEVGKHSEDMAEPPVSKPIDGNIGKTEIWWIPIIPLVFFPFVISIIWYETNMNSDFLLFNLVISFVMYPVTIVFCLSPILLFFYAIYLVRITRQRIENGTVNLAQSLFHLLSFIVPLLFLPMILLWAMAQGA